MENRKTAGEKNKRRGQKTTNGPCVCMLSGTLPKLSPLSTISDQFVKNN